MYETDEALQRRIGERIAFYRRENGDTQSTLAEKLSYSDKSISKWERGEGTPDIFILTKIADLYHIRVEDLLHEVPVRRVDPARRLLIALLSVGLVWLSMTVLFCGARLLGILPAHAWLLFVYGVPISGIVSQVFCALWWGRLAQSVSCSVILWGTAVSLVLSLPIDGTGLIFTVCGVVQVLLLGFFLLKHLSSREKS